MSPLVAAQVGFTRDVATLIEFAKSRGYGLTFGEVWRNPEMQEAYVASGKSWTMNSRHLDRLAVDLNLVVGGEVITSDRHPAWLELGDFWEHLRPQNVWGVGKSIPRKDSNHFERKRP